MSLTCETGKVVWHTYDFHLDGKPFGFAQWRKQGNEAEFHNFMYSSSLSALKLSREIFNDIKHDMAAAGCTCVVVTDLVENVDSARIKYWRFMGFEIFGEHEGYKFAVQGVN